MNITIEPLTPDTLAIAEELRNEVFGKTKKSEKDTLRASLDPSSHQKIYDENQINTMRYWVAKFDTAVIAIVGLYTQIDDPKDTCWLGWFCVDSKFRTWGAGKKLLDFVIHQAKSTNYKILQLYTHDSQEYHAAIRLYKREGFQEFVPSYKVAKNDVYFKKIISAA